MSPRGKATPAVDEQLFAATERVLARGGPGGVSSRAITDEAGVAKGILHNHFGDIDGFLAAFVLDRTARIAQDARLLIPLAGSATVLDNLAEATGRLFGATALAVSSLVISRPEVARRILGEHGGAVSVLQEIQDAIAGYLRAEQGLGRIAAEVDCATLAFTVFASTHQLFFSGGGAAIPPHRVRQVLSSLLGMAPPAG